MKVEIIIGEISKLETRTKWEPDGLITAFHFSARVTPPTIARILNMQKQGEPLYATIGSHQLAMDLSIEEQHAQTDQNETTQPDIFGLGGTEPPP